MTNITSPDFDKVISDKWESVKDSLPLSLQVYETFALGMRFGADWVSKEYWTIAYSKLFGIQPKK